MLQCVVTSASTFVKGSPSDSEMGVPYVTTTALGVMTKVLIGNCNFKRATQNGFRLWYTIFPYDVIMRRCISSHFCTYYVIIDFKQVCQTMMGTPDLRYRIDNEETRLFVLRVMVGLIILYDRVRPDGAFVKGSEVDVAGCVKVLKICLSESHPDVLVNLVNVAFSLAIFLFYTFLKYATTVQRK